MRFEVCFDAPITVEAEDVNAVLGMAIKLGVAVQFRPIAQPDITIEFTPTEPIAKSIPKKRGPKPKVKSVPEPAPAPGLPPIPKTPVSRDQVLVQFSALVENEFDRAAALLEEFGVSRFSELPDEKLAEFAAKL